MSILTTTSRVVANSIKHILRNPWDSITAILVMTLTVFVTSALGVMLFSSDKMLAYLENRLEVTAFFSENTTEDYILAIKQELEVQSEAIGVEQVRYISQDEALEIFKRQNQNNPETLEFVTADILPASLSVSARALMICSCSRNVLRKMNVWKMFYIKEISRRNLRRGILVSVWWVLFSPFIYWRCLF